MKPALGSKPISYRRPMDFDVRSLRPRSLVCVLWGLAVLLYSPWNVGGYGWESHLHLLIASAPMLAVLVATSWRSAQKKTESQANDSTSLTGPPLLSWLLGIAAAWSLLQTAPLFSSSDVGFAPQSVQLQRFFLSAPSKVSESRFFSDEMNQLVNRRDFNQPNGREIERPDSSEEQLAISVDPSLSRAATSGLIIAAILLWWSATFFRDLPSHKLLLVSMAGCGLVCCGWEAIQRVAWNADAWYTNGVSTSVGPFVSRNTGAAFLNICLGAVVGLFTTIPKGRNKYTEDRRYSTANQPGILGSIFRLERGINRLNTSQIFGITLIAIFVVAIIATASRGAALSTIAAAIVFFRASRTSFSTSSAILTLIGVSFVLIALEAFGLGDRLFERLPELGDELSSESGGRGDVWEMALRHFCYLGVFGVGLNGFRFSYLPFLEHQSAGWHHYAESFYFQTALELGWLGLGLLIVGLAYTFGKLRAIHASQTRLAIHFAFMFAVCAMMIHSIVDFGIMLPGVFVPFALLCGSALNSQKPKPRSNSKSGGSKQRARKLRGLKDASSDRPSVPEKQLAHSPPPEVTEPTNKLGIRLSSLSLAILLGLSAFVSARSLFVEAVCQETTEHLSTLSPVELATIDVPTFVQELDTKLNVLGAPESATAERLFCSLRWVELRQSWLQSWNETDWNNSGQFVKLVEAIEKSRESTATSEASSQDNLPWKDPFQKELLTHIKQRLEAAEYLSPMDWRIKWELELAATYPKHIGKAEFLLVLGQHRPTTIVAAAVLAEKYGEMELAEQFFDVSAKRSRQSNISIVRYFIESGQVDRLDTDRLDLDLTTLLTVADLYLKEDDFPAQNRKLWSQIQKTANSLSNDDSFRIYTEGRILERQGNFSGAIDKYTRLRTSFSRYHDAVGRTINCWINLGRNDEAEKLLKVAQAESMSGASIRRAELRLQEILNPNSQRRALGP